MGCVNTLPADALAVLDVLDAATQHFQGFTSDRYMVGVRRRLFRFLEDPSWDHWVDVHKISLSNGMPLWFTVASFAPNAGVYRTEDGILFGGVPDMAVVFHVLEDSAKVSASPLN